MAVNEISAPLKELELTIRKMIFEGLGMEKYYDSHVKSTGHGIRFARYERLVNQETTTISISVQSDSNLTTIIYQHQVEGLEIQTSGGQWIKARPNTFSDITGSTLMALTNGRLKSAVQRVKMSNDDTRYSVSFASHVEEGVEIDAPEESVDEEHPRLYKPFEYGQ